MRKVLLTILFIICFATVAYAIPPLPPCPNSEPCTPVELPWIPHTAIVALPTGGICPNCSITINWWDRKCGNGIQIKMGSVSVYVLSGDCSACMDWIPSFASRWVLKNDQLILDDLLPRWREGDTVCTSEIRLSRYSCFTWAPGKEGEVGPFPGWVHMVQCAPEITGCCEYTVRICKTADGNIDDEEYLISQPVECDEGCINNCSFNDNEVWLKQGVESPKIKECKFKENFEITPNPNDGNAHLKMSVNEKGVYKLTITDLRGAPIYETTLKLDGYSYESDISLTALSTGPYLYKVTIGNKTCFNGKVNIVK